MVYKACLLFVVRLVILTDNTILLYTYAALLYQPGASIETRVLGKRQLKLLNHFETYVMNSPNLVIKFLPVPDVEWLGNVTIRCQESGLEAELCFKGKSFLGRHNNYRSIRGKIVSLSKMETIYEINGHWDRYCSFDLHNTPYNFANL